MSLRQRLLLHRADLDTHDGRRALLRSLELNKLRVLAIGGCEGLDDRRRYRSTVWKTGEGGWHGWWAEFCGVIRTRGFSLEELVVEGVERGW